MPTGIKARDVIKNSMYEMGVLSVGEDPTGQDADFLLGKLNRLFDSMNIERLYAYTDNFVTKDEAGTTLNLIPNQQQIKIGPLLTGPTPADYQFAVRPVVIEACNVIIPTVSLPNQPVRLPLNIRDDDWWAAVSVRGVTSQLPTDLYYSPNFVNGELNFWPVPSIVYAFELEIRIILEQIATIDTSINFPPGYQELLTCDLAEASCPAFGEIPSAVLSDRLRRARSKVKSSNSAAPRISTCDSGVPSGNRDRPYFNFRTGQPM